jgi:hypothetical protein
MRNRKIVIARYNESIEWVKSLDCDYVIYNKGNDIDPSNPPNEDVKFSGWVSESDRIEILRSLENVRSKSRGDIKSDNIINVPNKGREAETWLRFIVENYDRLPDDIVFLQGNPFEHSPKCLEIVESNETVDDIVPLGPESHIGPIDNNGYYGLNVIGFQREIFGESDLSHIERIDFIAGAQFIVPKEFITNKSLDWWKSLYSYCDHYWYSGIDSIYNFVPPGHFIAHVFERLWPSIFRYTPGDRNDFSITPLLTSASY